MKVTLARKEEFVDPVFGMLLSPIIAGAAMAASSITVVTNANRLRLFEPKEVRE